MTTHIAVLGDVHGHLQLALSLCARWQQERGVTFDAVVLCGDVGTFTNPSQLDSTTRRHARKDPGELEFLTQWSTDPQAPWLSWIFKPIEDEGLGLSCPVIMTHGNHEGFEHLETLIHDPPTIPDAPVEVEVLPTVDTGHFIHWLPSGWRVALPGGRIISALGGIDSGQRCAEYHPMATIDDSAVEHLASLQPGSLDLLITHQGPACVQGSEVGASVFDLLVESEQAALWCHAHATPNVEMTQIGKTCVVPLEDVHKLHRETQHGWLHVAWEEGEAAIIARGPPSGLRDFRLHRWFQREDGLLISPDLEHLSWRMRGWPSNVEKAS